MKAITYNAYGGPEVLTYTELVQPIPKAKEVLVRIVSTSVTHGDVRMRKADPFMARLHSGLFKPNKYPVLGFECAGVIVALGEDVKDYKVGDEVMVFSGLGFGAYAEYMTVQIEGKYTKGALVKKPTGLTFDEAAVCPVGGITALGFLKNMGIMNSSGKSILIIGASGSVGSFAVQIAKHYGACVTGVTSNQNKAFVESLGAEHVIDYKSEDFLSSGKMYDLVFDAVGHYGKTACKKLLNTKGQFTTVKGSAKSRDRILAELADLLEQRAIKPVISRVYDWNEIKKAHELVDSGRKVGNVVVKVSK